eukprot:gene28281-37208_t
MAAVKNLNKHPDLFVLKEIHFFDLGWHSSTPEQYRATFREELQKQQPQKILVGWFWERRPLNISTWMNVPRESNKYWGQRRNLSSSYETPFFEPTQEWEGYADEPDTQSTIKAKPGQGKVSADAQLTYPSEEDKSPSSLGLEYCSAKESGDFAQLYKVAHHGYNRYYPRYLEMYRSLRYPDLAMMEIVIEVFKQCVDDINSEYLT